MSKMTSLRHLPKEILCKISGYLSQNDIDKVSKACKEANNEHIFWGFNLDYGRRYKNEWDESEILLNKTLKKCKKLINKIEIIKENNKLYFSYSDINTITQYDFMLMLQDIYFNVEKIKVIIESAIERHDMALFKRLILIKEEHIKLWMIIISRLANQESSCITFYSLIKENFDNYDIIGLEMFKKLFNIGIKKNEYMWKKGFDDMPFTLYVDYDLMF